MPTPRKPAPMINKPGQLSPGMNKTLPIRPNTPSGKVQNMPIRPGQPKPKKQNLGSRTVK